MREPACQLAARTKARKSGWAARRQPQTGLTVRRPPGAAFFAPEKQMANRLDKGRDDRAVLRGGDEIRLHASRTQALCGGPLRIAFKPPAFEGRPRSAGHAQFHSFASTDPKPEFAPQSIAICPSGKSAEAVFWVMNLLLFLMPACLSGSLLKTRNRFFTLKIIPCPMQTV